MHCLNNRWVPLGMISGLLTAAIATTAVIKPWRLKRYEEQVSQSRLSALLDRQRHHLQRLNAKIARIEELPNEQWAASDPFSPLAIEQLPGVQVISWHPAGLKGELKVALGWPQVAPVLDHFSQLAVNLERLDIHREKARLMMQITFDHANAY